MTMRFDLKKTTKKKMKRTLSPATSVSIDTQQTTDPWRGVRSC